MRKTTLAYATLACAIAAMLAALAAHAPKVRTDRDARVRNQRPRSIRERMVEERQSTGREALLAEEHAARENDTGDATADRDAFDSWFYDQRRYPGTSLPTGAIATANRHADSRNFDERDETWGPKWRPPGPETIPDGQTDASAGQLSPVSGRVTAIAADPSNPEVVYAAGAQGGVWKTRNALSPKPSWEPLTDHEASLAVGAIAIDPVNPDIVYVGTGESNRSCDS
jgi:hypothetical protein